MKVVAVLVMMCEEKINPFFYQKLTISAEAGVPIVSHKVSAHVDAQPWINLNEMTQSFSSQEKAKWFSKDLTTTHNACYCFAAVQ